MRAGFATDIGGRVKNEDACLVNETLGLFIVADGMGGHEKGEVASWFTSENLETIIESMKSRRRDDTFDDDMPDAGLASEDDLLKFAVLAINRRLYLRNEEEAAKCQARPGTAEAEFEALTARRRRMGTTLVSLLLRGGRAWITHVGDSRAYRIAEGRITRLTCDHTWVEERMMAGEITPEEARTHRKRNVILRSVGFKEDVAADVDVITLDPPERFLLCSDGLSNVVEEDDLLDLGRMEDAIVACGKMVDLAVERGGRDNITAVLVDVAKGSVGSASGQGPIEQTDL